MTNIFPFDHNKTNAPYILPDGDPDYSNDFSYSGHGHPSAVAFMHRFANPYRGISQKQDDIETLVNGARDDIRWGPRDWAVKISLQDFLLKINSSEQTLLDAVGVQCAWDKENIKELIKEVLVRAMGWSAIETISHNTITTAASEPHVTFFDYQLMGYDIQQVPRLVWDSDQQIYAGAPNANFFISKQEKEAAQELAMIDESLPLDQWWPDMPWFQKCSEPLGCEKCSTKYTGRHLVNGNNFITRRLAERATFFRNRQSEVPDAALAAGDTPFNRRMTYPSTKKYFG